jgi:hypothetical protein
MTGTLGVLVVLGLALQTMSLLWGYAAVCGIVVLTLAVVHVRFAIYAETAGALMLPVMLEFLSSSRLSLAWLSVLRFVVLMTFLLGPYVPAVTARAEASDPIAGCRVPEIAPVLLDKKNAIVLTEISDTPEILWRTPVRTVGSLYHRSIGAFMRARDAWRSVPSDVSQVVLATGATHILACDSSGRSVERRTW